MDLSSFIPDMIKYWDIVADFRAGSARPPAVRLIVAQNEI
jgi:hypothetical protein